MKRISYYLLIFLFLLLGQIKEINSTIKIVNLTNLGIVIFHIFSPEKFRTISLILLAFSFLTSAIIVSKSSPVILSEPIDESYRSDEYLYLKTYYLMKRGLSYYQAHSQAFKSDLRFEKPPSDIIAWRLPSVYYLWSTLSLSGEYIRIIFIILSTANLIITYFLLNHFVKASLAILSPYLLIPYFVYAINNSSFLFVEWWGLFFLNFGLLALILRRFNLMTLSITLSILIRELYLIPAIAIAVILSLINGKTLAFRSWRSVKKQSFKLLIVLSIALPAFAAFHLANIIKINPEYTLNLFGRSHPFSKALLLNTVAFATPLYKFATLRVGILFIIFSTLGLTFAFFTSKNKIPSLVAFLSFFLLFAASSFLGTADFNLNVFGDYWGISFMPIAIALSPTFLNIFTNNKE